MPERRVGDKKLLPSATDNFLEKKAQEPSRSFCRTEPILESSIRNQRDLSTRTRMHELRYRG